MASKHEPKTPLLTVDIIIEMVDREGRPIVLIERKNPPPGWALPGGFVDVGETVEDAARREAKEETTLDVTLLDLLGVYSDPQRDPRGHTVSVVYTAEAMGKPRAQDDAAFLTLYDINKLPQPLAFDHQQILDDYRRFREQGIRELLKR
jgi:8-oxo-dGTP diphosphatase